MMKTRVLVVDDDRLVADTLSLIYQANGFDCEARYTAADAFERAQSFQPALLLCDVTLQEESGLQLAERLQTALPKTRVLMLSAYASNEAKVSAHSRYSKHPLKLLSKPCRPELLLSESRALLQTT